MELAPLRPDSTMYVYLSGAVQPTARDQQLASCIATGATALFKLGLLFLFTAFQ